MYLSHLLGESFNLIGLVDKMMILNEILPVVIFMLQSFFQHNTYKKVLFY